MTRDAQYEHLDVRLENQTAWVTMNRPDSLNALNRKLYEIRRRLKPITDCINIRTIYGVGFIMEQKG